MRFFSQDFQRSLVTTKDAIDVRNTADAQELYESISATYGSYSRDMLMTRWVDQGRGVVPTSFVRTCPGFTDYFGDETELGGNA